MNTSLKLPIFNIGDHPAGHRELRYAQTIFNEPYMDAGSINRSMRVNMKLISDKYAAHCQEFNVPIDAYNKAARNREKEQKTITDLHTRTIKSRIKGSSAVNEHDPDPTAYNNFLVEYNAANGTNYELKRKQPIKDSFEKLMSILLTFYCAQLSNDVSTRKAKNRSLAMVLPPLKTNSWKIRNYKVEKVKQYKGSQSTVLRQIKCFEAANLLQFIGHGSQDEFEIYFNPNLLNINDYSGKKSTQKASKIPKKTHQNGNSQTPDNPSATFSECSNSALQDCSLTRTSINNLKRKEVGQLLEERNGLRPTVVEPKINQNTKDRNHPTPKPLMNLIKNIKNPAAPQKTTTPPPHDEEFKPAHKKSLDLYARIQDVYKIAGDLAAHKYDHYEPIPVEDLEWEIAHGSLTNGDFRDVAVQEFIKEFAAIYQFIDRHYTMAPKMWSNALKQLRGNLFTKFTGTAFSKRDTVDQWMKYRRMIQSARYSYRDKSKFYPCYPDRYLTRSWKISFWNLESKCERVDNQTRKRINERRGKILQILAIDREITTNRQAKRIENDYNKAVQAVRRYLDPENTRWTRSHLQQYCDNELLKKVSAQLEEIISREQS